MYYLKCNNCGELNKFVNGNLLFCGSCKKKLENNYRDWQRTNSDKGIEDFKKLVCVSEQEIPVESKAPKKQGMKYWISFTVSMIVFSLIGKFGAEEIRSFFSGEKTSEEILTKEWVTNTYGSFGLVVETPESLSATHLELPEQVQEVVEEMASFEYASQEGFKVLINSAKYMPVVQEVSLLGAAEGSVNMLRAEQGIENLDYSQTDVSVDEIPGFKQEGSFDAGGIKVEFVNLTFGRELNIWQVLVMFEREDEVGRKAAQRVVESITIKQT